MESSIHSAGLRFESPSISKYYLMTWRPRLSERHACLHALTLVARRWTAALPNMVKLIGSERYFGPWPRTLVRQKLGRRVNGQQRLERWLTQPPNARFGGCPMSS